MYIFPPASLPPSYPHSTSSLKHYTHLVSTATEDSSAVDPEEHCLPIRPVQMTVLLHRGRVGVVAGGDQGDGTETNLPIHRDVGKLVRVMVR